MYKSIRFIFFTFIVSYQLSAQIFPQEGSKLCYRLIGFSFPAETGAVRYTIEIAVGTHNTESFFEKSITTATVTKKNKTITEVPAFGCQYTWRTVCFKNNNTKTKSALHHFSTKVTPDVDADTMRLRITNSAQKYKDAYLFIDGARALYDMKGKPVWFLPGTDLKVNQNAYPRDLKATPYGTITFITGGKPYEINYDGRILWHYTNKTNYKKNVAFHHEFTRLHNGHYMGMIYETISGDPPPFNDSAAINAYDSAGFYRNSLYNTIVEYDEHNNLVWSWSGLEYEYNSDLRFRKTVDIPKMDHNLHENAFFFDEKNKTIYLSFKNISRIIKIKYPEGNVLNTYGTLYKPGLKDWDNDLFCLQHSCNVSQKGHLYIFNNNTCATSHIPTIVMFSEPSPGKNDLEKIWEYQCLIDDQNIEAIKKTDFHSGGNVCELPDCSIFVSMGQPYPSVFIVSPDKKILWSAIPEKYNQANKKWECFTELYRASFISRKDLEKLIWNSEK